MAVRANKPAFNIREKLKELERPIGLKGSELMSADTAQEARDLVSAGRKNMIINGAMQVAQRATSAATGTVPNANSTYYTCDRWNIFGIGSDNAQWTNSQSTDTPTGVGFGNSWKWDCTTADASPAANARQEVTQRIESQNLQHLRYGSSNPEEITVSFWVKATKTGTNYCWMYQYDGADFIAHKYYINQSNTWEKKTITFNGNTAASIANDNTAGINISWFLYAGSDYTTGTYQENKWRSWTDSDYNQFEDQTNHADSTSNDFYITGVQLEVGKNSTDFEHRRYGEELALCQRYYYRHATGTTGSGGAQPICNAIYYSTANAFGVVTFPTTMRDIDNLDQNGSVTGFQILRAGTHEDITTFSIQERSNAALTLECSGLSGTVGHGGWFRTTSDVVASVPYLGFSAEL